MEKDYKLKINPAILKFLGPSLYTNIYYVLAELIANAWDADAKNVYIIEKDNEIIVEDDGVGMSYTKGEINKYLNVAQETRVNLEDSKTLSNRIKMGRKGIGKLSALAVSSNVKVMTISNGEKTGFILPRNISEDGTLESIDDSDICFEKIKKHGTSIRMTNPEYKLNKNIEVIKRNLVKIFPIVNNDFKIHIEKNNKNVSIDSFDINIIKELSSIITLGKEYKYLTTFFNSEVEEKKINLKEERDEIKENIKLNSREGKIKEYELSIKGWIGTYKTTRGRKVDMLEFQDNFLSLYSNGKMGEFNILPKIGQNKLNEVYVVGQLHVDIFEDSSLPDMAASNRQSYKEDDERYKIVLRHARKLLTDIIFKREEWTNIGKKGKKLKKNQSLKEKQKEFNEKVLRYESNIIDEILSIISKISIQNFTKEKNNIKNKIKDILNKNKKLLDLKPIIDEQKKKILISQTRDDKDLADIIYEMLIYNGVSKDDIIYSNSDYEDSRIPENYDIYEYLRDFFVNSISNEKMYVIYVTSSEMAKSWGALVEVGANWITQMNHKIFNIKGFVPKYPLNNNKQWHESERVDNELHMDELCADIFCQKIEDICGKLGYNKRNREDNKNKLRKLVQVK